MGFIPKLLRKFHCANIDNCKYKRETAQKNRELRLILTANVAFSSRHSRHGAIDGPKLLYIVISVLDELSTRLR